MSTSGISIVSPDIPFASPTVSHQITVLGENGQHLITPDFGSTAPVGTTCTTDCSEHILHLEDDEFVPAGKISFVTPSTSNLPAPVTPQESPADVVVWEASRLKASARDTARYVVDWAKARYATLPEDLWLIAVWETVTFLAELNVIFHSGQAIDATQLHRRVVMIRLAFYMLHFIWAAEMA
ncbi:hypothetical protein Cob_v002459 [Colletotrichum orbiculare MAFF 240422]|uniref:Uncharacterized protein n=1 Tax=Colletotrichum orbiculare (strain 104-T / ATCC 96160 / CBS 514.97 / LARS 414 / MAFF 240422) TaxID=1213857 RepID=N4VVA4_COLOR|nr:hypothetical protein Cob_v002459 [Colletotrichum orbiculare MAFF 240422]